MSTSITSFTTADGAIEVRVEMNAPINVKSVSLIPKASDYDDIELIIELQIGDIGSDRDWLQLDGLLRDQQDAIIGRVNWGENIQSNSRCILSERRESFPAFAVLDLVGKAS